MLKNLIDFDSDLEPSQAGVQTEMQKTYSLPSTDVGWATFDVATQEKATVMPSNSSSNTLGDQLLQLSTSASAPPSGFPTVQNAKSSFPGSNHGGQQHQLSLSSAYNIQSSNPPLNMPNGAPVNDQLWVEALHATVQETSSLPASQGTNIFIGTHESVIGSALQQPPVEATSNGTKALPEDIYTMSFAPVHTSVWGWQTNPRVNMGYIPYGMIYPVGAVNTSQTFAHPNSINPFDAVQESRLAHSSTFPSWTSVQGALPDMGNSTSLSRASSMGSARLVWSPSQVPRSQAANPSTEEPARLAPQTVRMAYQGWINNVWLLKNYNP